MGTVIWRYLEDMNFQFGYKCELEVELLKDRRDAQIYKQRSKRVHTLYTPDFLFM